MSERRGPPLSPRCRSDAGADRAPADAWISFQASTRDSSSDTPASAKAQATYVGKGRRESGGPWARWSGRVRCVRAPGLVSVRDPVCRVGDVMVDGVVPRGDALRPLGRCRPSTSGWREQHRGSGPRGIGVRKGVTAGELAVTTGIARATVASTVARLAASERSSGPNWRQAASDSACRRPPRLARCPPELRHCVIAAL
jgi:hypothetical protein